jgi:hypothetical protein
LDIIGARSQGARPNEGYIAPFTPDRFDAIVGWLETPEQTRWAVSLLGTYLQHSEDWRHGVRALGARLASPRLRSLRLLQPDTPRAAHLRFIIGVLAEPTRQDAIADAVMKRLGREPILLPEVPVLDALTRDFSAALTHLENWLGPWSSGTIAVSVETMDRWISLLAAQTVERDSNMSNNFDQLAMTLSKCWSFAGRARLIARGEALDDPMRDLVLSALIPALTAFSFAELSRGAATRVLELYLSGDIDEFRSLGRAATEEFVEQVALPRAAGATEFEYNRLVKFLEDAGDALGRRYRLPN